MAALGLLRRRWYSRPGRQHRLRRPVVSVGNLSLGGRGKTPLVALLARWLVEAGERPAVLTRGYGRRHPEEGVVVVSDGRHVLADVDRAGDEPLMLARDVPGLRVLVGEQRALAGALAERALDATVHLLDDGFQHLQLARDIDLVVIGQGDLDDRPLPLGRLRDPVQALAFADAVIVEGEVRWSPGPSGPGLVDVPDPARWSPGPSGPGHADAFSLVRSIGDPVPLEPERKWACSDRRVVAVAGIAQPERFRRSLEARGWIVADMLGFADHHRYTRADLARIAAASDRLGAPVLTTSKDAVRLLSLRPLPAPVACAPLSVAVEPADAFRRWFFDRLDARQRATA